MGRGSHPQKMKLTLCSMPASMHRVKDIHITNIVQRQNAGWPCSHCVLCRVGILISEVKNVSVLFDFDAEGLEGKEFPL